MTVPTTWETLKYLVVYGKDADVLKILASGEESRLELMNESGIKYHSSLTRILNRLSSHGLIHELYVEEESTQDISKLWKASPISGKILELYEEMRAIAKEYDVKISSLVKETQKVADKQKK